MREESLVDYFKKRMEDWVVDTARGVANRSIISVKQDAVKDAVLAA